MGSGRNYSGGKNKIITQIELEGNHKTYKLSQTKKK